jgi:hypothetical protein
VPKTLLDFFAPTSKKPKLEGAPQPTPSTAPASKKPKLEGTPSTAPAPASKKSKLEATLQPTPAPAPAATPVGLRLKLANHVGPAAGMAEGSKTPLLNRPSTVFSPSAGAGSSAKAATQGAGAAAPDPAWEVISLLEDSNDGMEMLS